MIYPSLYCITISPEDWARYGPANSMNAFLTAAVTLENRINDNIRRTADVDQYVRMCRVLEEIALRCLDLASNVRITGQRYDQLLEYALRLPENASSLLPGTYAAKPRHPGKYMFHPPGPSVRAQADFFEDSFVRWANASFPITGRTPVKPELLQEACRQKRDYLLAVSDSALVVECVCL